MKVRFKKLSPEAVMPRYAHPTDAGLDLTAIETITVPANGRALIHTGIAMEIPIGYYGMVVGRSGNTIKRGLVGMTGIVDAGYRGEIGIMAFNLTDADIIIKQGERAGQIIITPTLDCETEEVKALPPSERIGGFGSTGGYGLC